MEQLKIRNPSIYKDEYLCPRCHTKKENLQHLWECSKADNEISKIQHRIKHKFNSLIQKSNRFRDTDSLFEKIFPFTKIKKNLIFRNEANRRFYLNQGNKAFKLDYTYVWDGSSCLDDILQGWIPNKLIDILFSHMIIPSRNFLKSLLFTWIAKINNLFFNLIWKKRNDEMISWEMSMDIDKRVEFLTGQVRLGQVVNLT
jgi:hypothetical protein